MSWIQNAYLDISCNKQDEVFSFIADKAIELNIATDKDKLIKAFQAREKEGSTGFEDGFAIPHARISNIKTTGIIVVRLKDGVNWDSLDGKPTKVAIALLVPEGNNNEHLDKLSEVAVKLMDENFKNKILNAKTEKEVLAAFEVTNKKDATKKELVGTKNILAITACVVGVAHTYLAEEKLIQAGKSMGYNVRVETHGSKGVGTPFSKKEIDSAEGIIFAVDAGVDKSRFAGLKQVEVKVAKAIHEPEKLITEVLKTNNTVRSNNGETGKLEVRQRDSVMKHLLSGVSYMIPVIVLGGICLAFSLGIAKALWGPSAAPDNGGKNPWGPLAVMNNIGSVAFALMIPILAGFIGNSVAGRAAIAPAMIAAYIGNNNSMLMPWPGIPGLSEIKTPMGFIGAMIAGLCAGYLVRWINTWKVPRSLQAAMPIFFIPLFVGLILSLAFIYVLGTPIGWVMSKLQKGIELGYGYNSTTEKVNSNLSIATGLFLGLLLGAMGGFDMGGPINKIAFTTCVALLTVTTDGDAKVSQDAVAILQRPMGSLACAIPVAPLGMGFTTVFFAKFFDKDSKNLGIGAIIMGCIGISEGAIPFAIKDPKRAIPSNVLGSAVAGAIGGLLGVQDAAGHGGPIVAILGAVPYGIQTFYFFLAAGAGIVVTTLTYGFWLLADAGKPGSVKEYYVNQRSLILLNHKDELSVLKDEMNALKNEYKLQVKEYKELNKDYSELEDTFNDRISALKNKIVMTKDEYKNKVSQNRIHFKEFYSQEKTEVKKESSFIKQTKKELENRYKLQIKEINKELSEKKDFANKKDKIEFKNELNNNKIIAKKDLQESLLNDSRERRLNYLTNYKQRELV